MTEKLENLIGSERAIGRSQHVTMGKEFLQGGCAFTTNCDKVRCHCMGSILMGKSKEELHSVSRLTAPQWLTTTMVAAPQGMTGPDENGADSHWATGAEFEVGCRILNPAATLQSGPGNPL